MRCVKIFNKYFAANTVVTYLRCGGIVNNQIKSGLLQSLPVNFFLNQCIFGIVTCKKVDCVVHCLRFFSSVVARRTIFNASWLDAYSLLH